MELCWEQSTQNQEGGYIMVWTDAMGDGEDNYVVISLYIGYVQRQFISMHRLVSVVNVAS